MTIFGGLTDGRGVPVTESGSSVPTRGRSPRRNGLVRRRDREGVRSCPWVRERLGEPRKWLPLGS